MNGHARECTEPGGGGAARKILNAALGHRQRHPLVSGIRAQNRLETVHVPQLQNVEGQSPAREQPGDRSPRCQSGQAGLDEAPGIPATRRPHSRAARAEGPTPRQDNGCMEREILPAGRAVGYPPTTPYAPAGPAGGQGDPQPPQGRGGDDPLHPMVAGPVTPPTWTGRTGLSTSQGAINPPNPRQPHGIEISVCWHAGVNSSSGCTGSGGRVLRVCQHGCLIGQINMLRNGRVSCSPLPAPHPRNYLVPNLASAEYFQRGGKE